MNRLSMFSGLNIINLIALCWSLFLYVLNNLYNEFVIQFSIFNYIMDEIINFIVQSNIITKILFIAIGITIIYKILAFIGKVSLRRKRIKNTMERNIENNDNPATFEDFKSMYYYPGRTGAFAELITDLKTISNLVTTSASKDSKAKTICIDGKWGSGKTSYVNILKDFNDSDLSLAVSTDGISINEQIENGNLVWVDEFQPWNFGNSTEMMTEFFKVLSDKVIDAGLSILPLYSWKYNDYANLASSALEETPFLKTVFQWFVPQKSMPELKKKICKDLQKLKSKIVFVLDDIDREDPEMVMEVLRLVKNVADFPNLIFILPLDYNRVAAIVESKYGNEYRNYLQKIINERYLIDQYSYEDLYSIFAYEMSETFIDEQLREIYDYYRIQVWLIGFRQRIDWLVANKRFVFQNNRLELNPSIRNRTYICLMITILENIMNQNIATNNNINHQSIELNRVITEINRNVARGNLSTIRDINLIGNQTERLLNTLFEIYNLTDKIANIKNLVDHILRRLNSENSHFSDAARRLLNDNEIGTNNTFERYSNHNSESLKIKIDNVRSLMNSSINEIRDFTFQDWEIINFLQEFAPSPRDIKDFVRMMLKHSLNERVRFFQVENGEMHFDGHSFIDYLISQQNFEFEQVDEPTFRPRGVSRFAPRIISSLVNETN